MYVASENFRFHYCTDGSRDIRANRYQQPSGKDQIAKENTNGERSHSEIPGNWGYTKWAFSKTYRINQRSRLLHSDMDDNTSVQACRVTIPGIAGVYESSLAF